MSHIMNKSAPEVRKSAVASAVAAALICSPVAVQQARADIYTFNTIINFTMLDPTGEALGNTGILRGNTFQTPTTGTLTFDTDTGTGSADIAPFFWLSPPSNPAASPQGVTFQAIGNGMGGAGDLLLGNLLLDWGGNFGIPVTIILDAAGLLNSLPAGGLSNGTVISGSGALPASDGTYVGGGFGNAGYLSLGPTPIATTTWNATAAANCGSAQNNTTPAGGGCLTVLPSGGLPLVADTAINVNKSYGLPTAVTGIGGVPMWDGPFPTFNANFDFTSLTVTSYTNTSVVPVPAALWLFGSGLLGLVGMARRKNA